MEGDIKVLQMVQKREKCGKWFETCYSTKGYTFYCIYGKKLGEWLNNVTYGIKLDVWLKNATYGIKL